MSVWSSPRFRWLRLANYSETCWKIYRGLCGGSSSRKQTTILSSWKGTWGKMTKGSSWRIKPRSLSRTIGWRGSNLITGVRRSQRNKQKVKYGRLLERPSRSLYMDLEISRHLFSSLIAKNPKATKNGRKNSGTSQINTNSTSSMKSKSGFLTWLWTSISYCI